MKTKLIVLYFLFISSLFSLIYAGNSPEQTMVNEIEKVESLIDSLGDVEFTDDYIRSRRIVKNKLNRLPPEQQTQVTNIELFNYKERQFDTIIYEQLDSLIKDIQFLNTTKSRSSDYESKLNHALSLYNALSDEKRDFFNTKFKALKSILDKSELENNQKRQIENSVQEGTSIIDSECHNEPLLNDVDNCNSQQTKTVVVIDSKTIRYSLIVVAVLICGIVLFIILRIKKKKKMNTNVDSSSIESIIDSNTLSSHDNKKENEISSDTSISANSVESVQKENSQNVVDTKPDSVSTTIDSPSEDPISTEWVVVGASVKGNGHIQSNMPCQDNNMFETFSNGWGIAIVSDGAGSAEHADLGSKIVVTRGMYHFKKLLENEEWIEKKKLPTDIEWLQKSYSVLKDIRNDVIMVAQKNNTDVKSLSATCLVVIYSPYGLIAVHVGDGRMGYKTMDGEWKPMMTPHKGDEANQTIFLVSDFWSIPQYTMSGVLVPESVVVREPIKAFALMSDGCENTAWQCTTLNSETGKYYDRNLPFAGFFNPLEETLITFNKENVPVEERQEKWFKFIECGTSGFVKEQDDKTMIYAVNVELMK